MRAAGEWDGRGARGAEAWGHILMAAILGAVLPGDGGSQRPSPPGTEGLMAAGRGRAAPARCPRTAASPSSSPHGWGGHPKPATTRAKSAATAPGLPRASSTSQPPASSSRMGHLKCFRTRVLGPRSTSPTWGRWVSPGQALIPPTGCSSLLPRAGSCSGGAQWGNAGQALGCQGGKGGRCAQEALPIPTPGLRTGESQLQPGTVWK